MPSASLQVTLLLLADDEQQQKNLLKMQFMPCLYLIILLQLVSSNSIEASNFAIC